MKLTTTSNANTSIVYTISGVFWGIWMSLRTLSMLFVVVFFICSVHACSTKTMIIFIENQIFAFVRMSFRTMRTGLSFLNVSGKIVMHTIMNIFSNQFKMFRINAQFNFTYMMNMMVWWYFTLKQFITKTMRHNSMITWFGWNRCRAISSTTSGTLPYPTSIFIYFITSIKTYYSRLSFCRHSINNIILHGV